MSSLKTSTAGLAALRKDEGAVDGIYDDPSGYATFGVGHLVHSTTKWGSFFLAAARSKAEWAAKLGKAHGVTYFPRSAVSWSDFQAVKSKAVELGAVKIAERKYGKLLDALSPAEKHTAKAIAEAATKSEAMLLAHTVDSILAMDVVRFERAVNKLVKPGALNQEEFDALISIAFNIGLGNFQNSTLLKRVNEQKHRVDDIASREMGIRNITEAFEMWRKSGGVVLAGLLHRRTSEAQRFLSRARAELHALRQLKSPALGTTGERRVLP